MTLALAVDGLSTMIQMNLTAIGGVTNQSELIAFSNALAKAIVTYIQTNAQVQAMVTSGQGAGGAVIGSVI